jgi:hypothetical protein
MCPALASKTPRDDRRPFLASSANGFCADRQIRPNAAGPEFRNAKMDDIEGAAVITSEAS